MSMQKGVSFGTKYTKYMSRVIVLVLPRLSPGCSLFVFYLENLLRFVVFKLGCCNLLETYF